MSLTFRMEFPPWKCQKCREPVEWIDAQYDLDGDRLVGVLHKECHEAKRDISGSEVRSV